MEEVETKTSENKMSEEKSKKYIEELIEDGNYAVKMIEEQQWEPIVESEGVELYRATYKQSPYMIYRSTMYIDDENLDNSIDYINYENEPLIKNEIEEMKKRDPLVVEQRIVEEYELDESDKSENVKSSFLVFTRNTSGSYWVSDREFLYMSILQEKDQDHVIQVSRSVDNDDEVLVKSQGGVRGKIMIVLSVKKEESKYRVDWILHVDPSGSIPSLLFNATFGQSVLNLAQRGKKFFEEVKKD